jgi:hypothetical protein
MVISALKKVAKYCSETLLTAFCRHYLRQQLPARPHGVMTQKIIILVIDFIIHVDFCSEEGGKMLFRIIFNSLLQTLLKTETTCQTTRCHV